ncbi:lytic transglycosylase domain-containing protein [Sphingosinicella sp.]|uniref:lytic transglycosylase domain-containing protein n=1 Tax=Sphingosinicella sp. TaxID=1917971 RepID=UPI0035B31F4E
MAPLRAAFALAVVLAAPAHADPIRRWQPFIDEAALRSGIPADWIARVMRAESGGHATRGGLPIRSPAGAIGLMQLMPGTWADMTARHGLGNDPDDPRANILGGAAYLRIMYDRFGFPALFAAYHAGPARYGEHLAGRPLPPETIAYAAAVTRGLLPPDSLPPHPPETLFVVRRTASLPLDTTPANTLFAVRRAPSVQPR